MTALELNNISDEIKLGGGAKFWVYVSPQKNTAAVVNNWIVTFSQGCWKESITSKNPTKIIQTPNLSGEFNIIITKSDISNNLPCKVSIPALPSSNNTIGCDVNNASMVGIIAHDDSSFGGINARFWTDWNALL